MARTPPRGLLAGLIVATAALGAAPAGGFELFGIHLWGEREDEDEIAIIDPLPYTVTLNVRGGDDALQGRLENASALYSDRDAPASGSGGLLAKARGDYRRLLAALYNAGYYGSAISIRIAGEEVADTAVGVEYPPNVPIVIDVEPGPPFRFGRTAIVNAPPAQVPEDDIVDTPASVGFRPGEPAEAGIVGQASALSIEQWRQLARAKARETEREVIADHASDRLDVTLTLDPGRVARYGPTRVVGTQRVDPSFVRFMADLPEGQSFDPDDIEDAENRLTRLGIFRSLRFEEAEEIGPDGVLPITIVVENRRRRTIGAGATLSTIDGLGITAYWLNRNLYGRAEQLRFDASIDGLIESTNPEDYDYNFGVTYTQPGIWTPDTNFVTGVVARQLDLDTYRERSITARAGISQLFGERLTGELFAEVSRARYEDVFGTRNFTTFALVGTAAYDRRDDPYDATRGYYLAAELRPFYEAEFDNTALRGTLEGRVYRSFGAEDRVTLAGRAKVGSFVGAPIDESPPNLLFFAGGGGSVRGYEYRSIGVEALLNGETETVGGRGLLEASAELRYRITDRFGAVGFVDAGFVSEDATLTGETDLRTGAGLGFRYFTGIGVLRADVATPINPRPDDSAVALYIGIGQAF